MTRKPMVSPAVLKRIRAEDRKRPRADWTDAYRRNHDRCAECGQLRPCLHTSSDNQFPQHSPRRASR